MRLGKQFFNRRLVSSILLLCCITQVEAAVIEGVRLWRAPDRTRLVFDLSEPVVHKVFTLENPSRIVLDINQAVMLVDLSQLDFKDSPVLQIRSAIREQKDVRVVLDLGARVKPRSFMLKPNEQHGDRLVIDLFDASAKAVVKALKKVEKIPQGSRDIVIAIDAGHGGEDPGAIGYGKVKEKTVALGVAKELHALFKKTPGYQAILIRKGDYYVGLRERFKIARDSRADLFLSIHADAFVSERAKGLTVYALSERGASSENARSVADKENQADLIGGVGEVSIKDKSDMLVSVLLDLSMTASIATSLQIGNEIISAVNKVARVRKNSVEQGALIVLKAPDIPSLLIETGYITNPTEAKNLNSRWYRRKLAKAIANGVTNFFGDYPPPGTWLAKQKAGAGESQSYTVVRGDSLSKLAQRRHVSVGHIKSTNKLKSDSLKVGQVLKLPAIKIASYTVIREHTISRGETLSGIAKHYRISTANLKKINNLAGSKIQVGQVLRIPTSS